jgi:hypothetical protein
MAVGIRNRPDATIIPGDATARLRDDSSREPLVLNLNILIRGQSNAILFVEWPNWIGWTTLEAEVERLLGFDGRTNDVSRIYERFDESAATAYSATAFLGEWMTPNPGGWETAGWSAGRYEQGLLRHIDRLDPAFRDDPTAVLWLHSEYDSQRRGLTAEEWTSAVRADMGLVRAALGQPDAPYHFVSAQPYSNGSDVGHQAIRLGMERLASDPAARAHIAARANDLDMAGDGGFGGSHLDGGDAVQIAQRAARSIAESWAAHAQPGSPVALAGGDLADEGPRVAAARLTGPRTVEVDVVHDRATGFSALDPDAAAGVGWAVRAPAGGGWTDATGAAVVDADTLRVTFGADLPADGASLFYGWGYGRLAGADGSGRGNAVYDNQGLLVWVPAQGLALEIDDPPSPPPPGTGTEGPDALDGTGGPDSMSGLADADTLRGLAGDDTLDGGTGADSLLGGAGDDTLYLVGVSGRS